MSLHFKLCMAVVGAFSCVLVIQQLFGIAFLYFASPTLNRRYQTWLQRLWVNAVGGLIHPIKLVVSGDIPKPEEPAIFIVNHQVDADWWFMWVLAKFFGMHGHVKIILKHTLKWIPVVGWGMQNFEFIFLHRDLKKDGPYLEQRVKAFLKDDFPFWILLFPEGTTVHTECITKSQAFAKEHNRPILTKTVLPRVNGFSSVLTEMPDTIRVYDCTMVYSAYTGDVPDWNDGYERKRDKEVPSLHKMFTGMRTPPTHLYIKEYVAADIKKRGIEEWLDERWVEKDSILAHYATTNQMPEDIAKLKTVEMEDAGSMVGVALFVAQLSVLALVIMGWTHQASSFFL